MAHGYRLPDPKWQGPLRKCCVCGLLDAPVYAGESDEEGKPLFIHKIVIDLVFIERDHVKPDEKAKGFLYMRVADKHAKVRMICRDCLQDQEDIASAWKDYEKMREQDALDSMPANYYAQLCSE